MGVFGDVESTVEIFLRGPLLDLVSEATRHEDEELSDALSKLRFVHVQTFSLHDVDESELKSKVRKTAQKLEKDGWETVVRVREEDEHVYIYIKPGGSPSSVAGLIVMSIEPDDEAAFINIVGNIDLKQIGRLGSKFDIDPLEDIHIKTKKRSHTKVYIDTERGYDEDDEEYDEDEED
jgi:hypothetical protein